MKACSFSNTGETVIYSDSTSYSEDDDTDYSMISSDLFNYDDDDRAIVLRKMRELESSIYKRPRAHSMPEIFRGLWRKQIVEWMYVLIKYCKLRHEATAAAVYYLDAAVMCETSSLVETPKDYQLCAMTALHLALKVYDSPTMRVIKLSCLVKLGNGKFTEDDIIQKEQDLVSALGWRINPPTADCFLQRYLELLPFMDDGYEYDQDADSFDVGDSNTEQLGPIQSHRHQRLLKLEGVASEYIEVAMARDRFLSVPPSVIAYASLLSAMELITSELQQETNANHEQQPHEQRHTCYYDWSAFLRNMTEIAEMGDIFGDFGGESFSESFSEIPDGGNVSRLVRRTKMLLDRIVKGVTLPPEEEDDSFFQKGLAGNAGVSCGGNNDKESDDRCNFSECATSCATKSSSPPSPTSTVSSVNQT